MASKWAMRLLVGSAVVVSGRGEGLRGAAKEPAPAAPGGLCKVADHVKCPGSGVMCSGDQCCPGIPETQNKTFPCPSAPFGSRSCASHVKVSNCVPCLCSFDIDRTLTGKQGALRRCPKNLELPIVDWAYGGGNLTLSPVGRSIGGTFCAKYGCYVAVVTAGDGSGYHSAERQELEKRLGEFGGLPSLEWSGPSKYREGRTNCSGWPVNGTLVAGCDDGTKQFAVASVVAWLEKTQGAKVAPEAVWHYDDKDSNVLPFRGTGFNAREVSCETRDGNKGLCGATDAEIVDELGVVSCQSSLMLP